MKLNQKGLQEGKSRKANSFFLDFKHILKTSLLVCLFYFLAVPKSYGQVYKSPFTSQEEVIYQTIFSLELDRAKILLSNLEATPAKLYLEHLSETIALFISEDPALFSEFEGNHQQRISDLKGHISDEDPLPAFYLAEMKLHWGFIYLKFGKEWTAAWTIRQAYRQSEKNLKQHPEFKLQNKTAGVLYIMLGSVPENYQWVLQLAGLKGDIRIGVANLNLLSKSPGIFQDEITGMLALIHTFMMQDPAKGIALLNPVHAKNPNNLLYTYLMATLYMKDQKSAKALDILRTRNMNKKLFPFDYINYMEGELLLHAGQYAAAIEKLDQFHKNYKGENYIRDAHFKTGLSWYLLGDPDKAEAAFHKALEVGNSRTEADLYATNFIKGNHRPHPDILKVRFFTDGGYYEKAFETIEFINPDALQNEQDRIELIYRKARLLHLTQSEEKALEQYADVVIKAGENPWYFAPNSCLQMGYIYLKQGDKKKAEEAFKAAMTYKKHPYKNSIDHKAKSALSGL